MNRNIRIYLADSWMTLAALSFILIAILGRYVLQTLNTFELMLHRSLVGLIIISTIASKSRRWLEIIKPKFLKHHFTRNICHFSAQNLWFLALPLIPLGHLVSLEFTSLLWITIFVPILLKERLTLLNF